MIKIFSFAILFACGTIFSTNAQTKKRVNSTKKNTSQVVKPLTLQNGKDSLSYALGLDIAKSLKKTEFDLDIKLLQKAIGDAFDGNINPIIQEAQVSDIIQSKVTQMIENKNAELKKTGEDFLAKNKQNAQIKVTPEGVQYEILIEGTGVQPTADDEVKVHYLGTLIDGTKFDSSYDRNEPLDLNLNRVIEGWKIGIPLMKVGSKYRFYIPYHLAYGERATGLIPAFSTLIFEVELIGINPKDAI